MRFTRRGRDQARVDALAAELRAMLDDSRTRSVLRGDDVGAKWATVTGVECATVTGFEASARVTHDGGTWRVVEFRAP